MNRYPLTGADVLDLLAPVAVATALAALSVAGLTMRAPDTTFALVQFTPSGDSYTLDYGLTRSDCERARLASVAPLVCEAAEG